MTSPTTQRTGATRPAHHDIPALKERLLIPEVWLKLELEGQPAAKCRSPFRPDKTPSFSIYDNGRRWKDFATGDGGDVIDFIAMARQISTAQALGVFLELAGVPRQAPGHTAHAAPGRSGGVQAAHPAQARAHGRSAQAGSAHRTSFKAQVTALLPPPEEAHPDGLRVPLHNATAADRRLVAETRRLTPEAVSLALGLRTLTFSIVQGYRCWLLTDAGGRIAEARRLDGMPFPECGTLGRRKAHTLRGSRKSWPLGVAVLRRIPNFRTLLLVEGGPDYLAALHFAHELERWDVLPVAMLGRGTGARIDAGALELMRSRRVRIYPHADADGGGMKSARMWATQLIGVDCEVDFFDFALLHRTDDKPIKDLNDCTTSLDEESTARLCHILLPKSGLEVAPPH